MGDSLSKVARCMNTGPCVKKVSMISWSGFNSIEKLLLLGLLTNISEGDVKQKCTCVVCWANMLRRCRDFLYKS